jgi:hypothetical protein
MMLYYLLLFNGWRLPEWVIGMMCMIDLILWCTGLFCVIGLLLGVEL